MVAFFEELGWTGFAVPELRKRYGILTTGLIVGLLWGVWHVPSSREAQLPPDALPPALFLAVLLFLVAALPGAHGVGLRPYKEPNRRDAYAHPSRSRPVCPPPCGDIRGTRGDL